MNTLILALALALPATAAPPAPAPPPPPSAPEAQILERFEAEYPEHIDDLMALRESDPDAYRDKLRHLGRKWMADESSPELEALRADTEAIETRVRGRVRAYRMTDDAELRAELRGEIEPLAEALFEARMELHRAEIRHAQERIGRMEAKIAEREDNREDFLAEQLDRWLAED